MIMGWKDRGAKGGAAKDRDRPLKFLLAVGAYVRTVQAVEKQYGA